MFPSPISPAHPPFSTGPAGSAAPTDPPPPNNPYDIDGKALLTSPQIHKPFFEAVRKLLNELQVVWEQQHQPTANGSAPTTGSHELLPADAIKLLFCRLGLEKELPGVLGTEVMRFQNDDGQWNPFDEDKKIKVADSLITVLKCAAEQLAQHKRLENLLTDLQKAFEQPDLCAPGVISRLQDFCIAHNPEFRLSPVSDQYRQRINAIVEDLAAKNFLTHVLRRYTNPGLLAGNQIHFVNAVKNLLADRLGLPAKGGTGDDHADSWYGDARRSLSGVLRWQIKEALRADRVFLGLAEDYFVDIHAKQIKLDAWGRAGDKLAIDYGQLDPRAVFNSDVSDYAEHPDLLALHLQRALGSEEESMGISPFDSPVGVLPARNVCAKAIKPDQSENGKSYDIVILGDLLWATPPQDADTPLHLDSALLAEAKTDTDRKTLIKALVAVINQITEDRPQQRLATLMVDTLYSIESDHPVSDLLLPLQSKQARQSTLDSLTRLVRQAQTDVKKTRCLSSICNLLKKWDTTPQPYLSCKSFYEICLTALELPDDTCLQQLLRLPINRVKFDQQPIDERSVALLTSSFTRRWLTLNRRGANARLTGETLAQIDLECSVLLTHYLNGQVFAETERLLTHLKSLKIQQDTTIKWALLRQINKEDLLSSKLLALAVQLKQKTEQGEPDLAPKLTWAFLMDDIHVVADTIGWDDFFTLCIDHPESDLVQRLAKVDNDVHQIAVRAALLVTINDEDLVKLLSRWIEALIECNDPERTKRAVQIMQEYLEDSDLSGMTVTPHTRVKLLKNLDGITPLIGFLADVATKLKDPLCDEESNFILTKTWEFCLHDIIATAHVIGWDSFFTLCMQHPDSDLMQRVSALKSDAHTQAIEAAFTLPIANMYLIPLLGQWIYTLLQSGDTEKNHRAVNIALRWLTAPEQQADPEKKHFTGLLEAIEKIETGQPEPHDAKNALGTLFTKAIWGNPSDETAGQQPNGPHPRPDQLWDMCYHILKYLRERESDRRNR